MNLTKKQLVLKRVAEEKGVITVAVANQVYNTEEAARNALRTLERTGVIAKGDVVGKFDYVGDKALHRNVKKSSKVLHRNDKNSEDNKDTILWGCPHCGEDIFIAMAKRVE